MPKTLDDNAYVLLAGSNIDEAADKFHIWDDDAGTSGQDKHTTLNELITRIKELQTFFSRAPDYDSGEQTVSTDTRLTLAHGLGAIPRRIEIFLRCKTPTQGYLVNQEVPMFDGSQTTDGGIVVARDATNIEIIQGADISLLGRTTFNKGFITTSSWRWVVRAWK